MTRLLPRLALALAVLAGGPALADDAGALARTRALIRAFEAVPPTDGPASEADRARAFRTLDGFLDLEALTEDPIRPHWDRFTDAERDTFLKGFRDLIRRIAYPDSGAFFREAEVELSAPRPGDDGEMVVTLETRLPEEGLTTQVGLHWKPSGGALRLVDVSFDGDSVVTDYRNQFARILGEEGVEGLLRRLEARRAELERQGR